jgi:photosystem II stability/assembly factor-like uncharacterized protein
MVHADSAKETVSVLVIGTTEGVFVWGVEPGGSARASNLTDRDVKVLRRTGQRVLAGTADGMYLSDDGGCTWQPSGLEGREVLEVMPASSDPRVVYASTRPPALFRSRDRGETWSEIESFTRAFDAESWGLPNIPSWPPGARAHAIVVDATNPERCLVGIEVGGVVSTEDDGATWSTVLPGGNPDVHYLVADPSRSETLYVSTGFGRIGRLAEQPNEERIAGMFGSDDGGRSWRYLWADMQRQYTRPLCIDPRPPHALTVGTTPSAAPYITYRIAGGAQGRMFQSTDRGATWRSLDDADHSPSVAAPLCVTAAPDAAGNVLLGTDQGEVWHISAGDARWTLLVEGLPPVQSVLAES